MNRKIKIPLDVRGILKNYILDKNYPLDVRRVGVFVVIFICMKKMYDFFAVSQTYDNLTNILLYYNNYMDALEKANIPEFIRSNDGTNRITNLAEINALIGDIDSQQLIFLFDELVLEMQKSSQLLLPIQRQIYDESDMIEKKIIQRWEEKIRVAAEEADLKTCLELWDEFWTEIGNNNMLRKITVDFNMNYIQEVIETYKICAEEVKNRHKKNIQHIKKRLIPVAIAIIATSVGLLILRKSENISNFIRLSWEKIHQILSPE
jgi:hypothetical protein